MTEEQAEELTRERYDALHQIEEWLELPVLILGFIWLILLFIELIWGLSPFLSAMVYVIWGIFVFDFMLRVALAPKKLEFLRRNWLTVLSLIVPALRILRIAWVIRLMRLAPAARGVRLVKVVGSLNRGMRALRASMGRRGFGYVILLSVIVTLISAAGMFAFEVGPAGERTFANYGDALWWTAMVMTTLGSDIWPVSPEGRILSFLLSLYAFTVFGYVTATLATFFIGQEAVNEESELSRIKSIEGLRVEIQALRAEIQTLSSDSSTNWNANAKQKPPAQ